MNLELRHLRYFAAVAEERHITRAAERLSMQQPPLSQQIKALEDRLGVRLFHRRPRGVELTEAGAAFQADVTAVFERLDEAVARVRRVARGEEGRIAVGFTGSVIFHPAVRGAIRAFRDANREIAVVLEEDGSSELLRGVAENRLDAAFARLIPGNEGLRSYALTDEPMSLALPEGHVLAAEKGALSDLRALGAAPLILYRRSAGPVLYDRIVGAFAQIGISPNVVQEAPRVVATLNLVAAGLGLTIVPDSLCGSHLEGVAYRPIRTDPPLTAPIHLVCRKTEGSAAVRAFVEAVRSLALRTAVTAA